MDADCFQDQIDKIEAAVDVLQDKIYRDNDSLMVRVKLVEHSVGLIKEDLQEREKQSVAGKWGVIAAIVGAVIAWIPAGIGFLADLKTNNGQAKATEFHRVTNQRETK